MSKHMATSGRYDKADETKSQIVLAIVIALMMAVFVGWGENYIAQKEAEAHLEEAAQHEMIADEFGQVMAGYQRATKRHDPSYQYEIRVDEDGEGLYLDEWGSDWGLWNQHYNWRQLVEKSDQLRHSIETQVYDF